MKPVVLFASALLAASTFSYAQDNETAQKAEEKPYKTSIALSVGAFFPTSSKTKDIFDDSWTRINLTSFEAKKPQQWRFCAEASGYQFDGPTDLDLYSISFGYTKGIGKQSSTQPYVSARLGPYYGKIRDNIAGTSESNIGLSANTALGVVFSERFYIEARYDIFSRFAGVSLDGFSLTAGIKLFDINL